MSEQTLSDYGNETRRRPLILGGVLLRKAQLERFEETYMSITVGKKNADVLQADGIREIYTNDTVVALNAALMERGVKIEQIVSIFSVPGQVMGQPVPPQFRVLYRSSEIE